MNSDTQICQCGFSYFEEVIIQKYKSTQTNLYLGAEKVEKEHALKLLRCFNCGKYLMPALSYTFMPDINDQRLAKQIAEIINKKNSNK